jgi:UDP-glucuronate 4-epimerase
VTGVAGFIGSALAERLLADGWHVRGVDRFTSYYEEATKRDNLRGMPASPCFELVEADLLTADLLPLLDGVDVVFHEAGQPGVRLSWADGFALYNDLNVNLTQRLLEAVHRHPVERFVFASSSSVYGNARTYPTSEDEVTAPFSPYGITKLAAELLCRAYSANFELPTVVLRYFTVYGPRQRPDMALHRLIDAARSGQPFPLHGTGEQVRDFTYVDDAVDATVRSAIADVPAGAIFNVAGGDSATLNELIDLAGQAVGRPVPIERLPQQAGDVARTGGDIRRAAEALAWAPSILLADGVRRQAHWQCGRPG